MANLPEIKTGEGEGNHIRIDVFRQALTINGKSWKLELDLEGVYFVSLIANYWDEDGMQGYSTQVEGFTLWESLPLR